MASAARPALWTTCRACSLPPSARCLFWLAAQNKARAAVEKARKAEEARAKAEAERAEKARKREAKRAEQGGSGRTPPSPGDSLDGYRQHEEARKRAGAAAVARSRPRGSPPGGEARTQLSNPRGQYVAAFLLHVLRGWFRRKPLLRNPHPLHE